jgi:hypothetical protein
MLHLHVGDQRIEPLELEFFYLQLQLCYRMVVAVVVVVIIFIISIIVTALLLLMLFGKKLLQWTLA